MRPWEIRVSFPPPPPPGASASCPHSSSTFSSRRPKNTEVVAGREMVFLRLLHGAEAVWREIRHRKTVPANILSVRSNVA